MPTYEFMCRQGHKTEKRLSFDEHDHLPQVDGMRSVKCTCGEDAVQGVPRMFGFNMNYPGGERH